MSLSSASEAVLRERYGEERNEVLAKELGVSVRTVARWAAKLGLKKSERWLAQQRWDAVMVAQWKRLCGHRVGGFEKGKYKGVNWSGWKKGERAFSGEAEKKRVAALRERGMDERRRIRSGQERKTRWRMWEGWKEK